MSARLADGSGPGTDGTRSMGGLIDVVPGCAKQLPVARFQFSVFSFQLSDRFGEFYGGAELDGLQGGVQIRVGGLGAGAGELGQVLPGVSVCMAEYGGLETCEGAEQGVAVVACLPVANLGIRLRFGGGRQHEAGGRRAFRGLGVSGGRIIAIDEV
jgi:hypothetical protein